MNNSQIDILYFNSQEPDYLADSILIGLLQLPHVRVKQFPIKDVLYRNRSKGKPSYGNGFTLYNIFDDYTGAEVNPKNDLQNNRVDLVIFSNINRQSQTFEEYKSLLSDKQIWFLDGEDTPSLYPYLGKYLRQIHGWFLTKPLKKGLYFKREWTPESLRSRFYNLLPSYTTNWIPTPRNLKPISFSIPAEKIYKESFPKSKMFPQHIVDPEISQNVQKSSLQYAFGLEQEYYKDLQSSRFGITTKRAGWDCMRHYEIAANRAVICFKDLNQKPPTCAPHGLIHDVNCISYRSYEDLMNYINKIDIDKYLALQAEGLKWVVSNSCDKRASQLLDQYYVEKGIRVVS